MPNWWKKGGEALTQCSNAKVATACPHGQGKVQKLFGCSILADTYGMHTGSCLGAALLGKRRGSDFMPMSGALRLERKDPHSHTSRLA